MNKFSHPLSKLFPTIFPVKISAPELGPYSKKRPALISFSLQDQILFTKRLGMMLRSGMPILEGLYMMAEESRTRSSVFIYQSLAADVSNGQTLSSSLNKFPAIFGEFGISIIRIGERSGTLHENLEYLAGEMKRQQTLKRKVVGALIYPAVIVCATIGITVMLTVYIFPKIVPIFASVQADLPLTTRILMKVSSFLSNDWMLLAGSVVTVIVVFAALRRAAAFRFFVDFVILRLPLFGKLTRLYNLTNICRAMSLLLKSEVHIVESIELVANSTKNLVYRRELFLARDRLMRGQNISSQFKTRPDLFPQLLSQMAKVAETTGSLAGTFEFLSGMFEEEIDEFTKSLTTLIEPILMITMGIVVGFIAISIITPIYSITQGLTPR